MMTMDLYTDIQMFLEKFTRTSKSDKMLFAIRKGDVIVNVPEMVIDRLMSVLNTRYPIEQIQKIGSFIYCGIEFRPGYEMAFVMFHKQYLIYKEDWMINKISLEEIHQEEWVNNGISAIRDLI